LSVLQEGCLRDGKGWRLLYEPTCWLLAGTRNNGRDVEETTSVVVGLKTNTSAEAAGLKSDATIIRPFRALQLVRHPKENTSACEVASSCVSLRRRNDTCLVSEKEYVPWPLVGRRNCGAVISATDDINTTGRYLSYLPVAMILLFYIINVTRFALADCHFRQGRLRAFLRVLLLWSFLRSPLLFSFPGRLCAARSG
jgi:hypothetical protein